MSPEMSMVSLIIALLIGMKGITPKKGRVSQRDVCLPQSDLGGQVGYAAPSFSAVV